MPEIGTKKVPSDIRDRLTWLAPSPNPASISSRLSTTIDRPRILSRNLTRFGIWDLPVYQLLPRHQIRLATFRILLPNPKAGFDSECRAWQLSLTSLSIGIASLTLIPQLRESILPTVPFRVTVAAFTPWDYSNI
jgi:hypothetical protein